jgi:DNA-binding beta-propeller fold protein YncE
VSRRGQALTSLVLVAAGLGSCTSSTGPTFPDGAQPVPPSFATTSVSELPERCTGQTYFEAGTSLCPSGITYFLCDGSSYTEFDCNLLGPGWTEETVSQDRVAEDPAVCPTTAPMNGTAGLGGTVYVEANQGGSGDNSILVFRYCEGALTSSLVDSFPTGGTGAADLDDTGVLDADQQVVVNGDETLLFAVNQGSDTIAAFQLATDGLLTPVPGSPFPSGGFAPASVIVAGNILVVANKAFDGVRDLRNLAPNYTTFTIASDGSLTPTGSTFALPLGAAPTQVYVAAGGGGGGGGDGGVVGGDLVFTTEESGVFRVLQMSATGALVQAPGSPMSLPSGVFANGYIPNPVWPAGLSSAPGKSILYTGIPNNGSIAAFAFSAAGELSFLSDETDRQGLLPCWSVVSADGRRLYFANAGSDDISVWDIATNPTTPRLLQTFGLAGGGNPWGLHLDATDQLLFVITPRQVYQVPEDQGQLLHALRLASDGTIDDEVFGSPAPLSVAADTNPFGLAVVAAR